MYTGRRLSSEPTPQPDFYLQSAPPAHSSLGILSTESESGSPVLGPRRSPRRGRGLEEGRLQSSGHQRKGRGSGGQVEEAATLVPFPPPLHAEALSRPTLHSPCRSGSKPPTGGGACRAPSGISRNAGHL